MGTPQLQKGKNQLRVCVFRTTGVHTFHNISFIESSTYSISKDTHLQPSYNFTQYVL